MSTLLERMEKHAFVNVREVRDGIVACNFTREAFRENIWDGSTTAARGLFLDTHANGRVVARGYEKFFGLGEYNGLTDEEYLETVKYPVQVTEKGNGYLGIISVVHGRLEFYSKSGTTVYSEHLKDYFLKNTTVARREVLAQHLRTHNQSLLVEMIDPFADPHIVAYDKAVIMLLDLVHNEEAFKIGNMLRSTFRGSTKVVKGRTVERILNAGASDSVFVLPEAYFVHNETELKQAIAQARASVTSEGVVMRDANSLMVKIKSDFYKIVKSYRTSLGRALKGRFDERGQKVVDLLAEDGLTLEEFTVTGLMGQIVIDLPKIAPYILKAREKS